jgi:hypothetical protein
MDQLVLGKARFLESPRFDIQLDVSVDFFVLRLKLSTLLIISLQKSWLSLWLVGIIKSCRFSMLAIILIIACSKIPQKWVPSLCALGRGQEC